MPTWCAIFSLMKIAFEKYQGSGNDFILIDDRQGFFPESDLEKISFLCHRHFGIGSDGLMLIRGHREVDFEMIFFNPDGSRSLCGNGSRCAVHLAKALGIAGNEGEFETTDGTHAYRSDQMGEIAIRMHDISKNQHYFNHRFIHTGSPHLIVNKKDVDHVDVVLEGRTLRNNPAFADMKGSNINFVSPMGPNSFGVRTYERGVEDETLSCGTGVTAVAIAMALDGLVENEAEIHTHGGVLKVRFHKDGNKFTDIWLSGPVNHVYSGVIDA